MAANTRKSRCDAGTSDALKRARGFFPHQKFIYSEHSPAVILRTFVDIDTILLVVVINFVSLAA